MNRADEIDLMKRRIEVGLEEYRQSLLAYAEWLDGWRKRQAAEKRSEYPPNHKEAA